MGVNRRVHSEDKGYRCFNAIKIFPLFSRSPVAITIARAAEKWATAFSRGMGAAKSNSKG